MSKPPCSWGLQHRDGSLENPTLPGPSPTQAHSPGVASQAPVGTHWAVVPSGPALLLALECEFSPWDRGLAAVLQDSALRSGIQA